MLFPRAIQVSRLLRQLSQSGWRCSVVCLKPSVEVEGGVNDVELASYYSGSYLPVPVDMTDPPAEHPFRQRSLWRRQREPKITLDPTVAAWVDRASEAVRSCVRAGGADVLLTFAQPWSDHMVGLRLRARLWRLPWIAHFSDPWVDSPYFTRATEEERAVERRLEAQVVRWADALVFVTERTADLVMAKYPARYRSKVHVLPHGFDREMLNAAIGGDGAVQEREPGGLRIVFTGQLLQGMRTPDALLRALHELRAAGSVDGSTLEVVFVGLTPPDTVHLVESLGLGDTVRFVPRVAYFQSLREAARADVLLLIDASSQNSVFLPSKFVDYLMLGRPILGITPRSGAVGDVMDELGYPVVEPADVPGARKALLDMVGRWRLGTLRPSPAHAAVARRYDIRRTAAQMERVLESVLAQRRGLSGTLRWLVGSGLTPAAGNVRE